VSNRRRQTRIARQLSRIERSQPSARPGLPGPRIDNSSVDQAIPVAVRDLFQKLSLFVAPPTLVIALAYWFGWTLTSARSAYFGIDSSTLGYSTTDYLLRSADAAFVPVAIVLLAVLAAILLHGFIQRAVVTHRGPAVVRRGAAGGAAFGAFLTFFAVWSIFRPLPVATSYLVPPVILGLGPALIAYSMWTLRNVRAPARDRAGQVVPAWERSGYVIAAMLALLGIFWASSLYAAALGRGRAQVLSENLSRQPAVTVFSVRSLGIDAAGVAASQIADGDPAYKFRYSGLRLLVHSADKYFLVNDDWSRERGVTIVLRDTSDIRVEFTPGG
jgi:hypothetical protein